MKMTPDDYQTLKDKTLGLLKAIGEPRQVLLDYRARLEQAKKEGHVKNVETRFNNDLLNYQPILGFVCDTLYKYLNGNHVETAMKRILQEILNGES